MSAPEFFELLLAGFRRIVKDILSPLFGFYLVYRLGLGKFEVEAVPFVITLASAMIGIPVLTRSDERRRSDNDSGGGGKKKRRKEIRIGWGGDDDDPSDQ